LTHGVVQIGLEAGRRQYAASRGVQIEMIAAGVMRIPLSWRAVAHVRWVDLSRTQSSAVAGCGQGVAAILCIRVL
jgi:hypothetical protein